MKNNESKLAIRNQIDDIRRRPHAQAFEKWREIGRIVIDDLAKSGRFFNTEQGLFFFDDDSCRAAAIDKDDMTLATLLNHVYGINPKEIGFKRVLADLASEAHSNGRKIPIRRFAHYDETARCLYVSRFDGNVYRLDGASVERVKNGTDNVFFFDDERQCEPYEYTANVAPGEFDRQLIESVNFADSTLSKGEQRKLLRLWIMAVFFGSIQPTKIILLMLGDHGSGKTSALRRIQKFIFGGKADLLSIEKDKQDGFVATVTTDPLALFDNLDERISWLPFNLSRLATGVTFARRELYTTNQKAFFPGVSWLGITSRSVDFMAHQPDLPDRTLVLKMERLNEKRPECELLAAIAQSRNAMWSELLDQLNSIVRHLRDDPKPIPVQLRMADFASFALKVATIWRCREEVEAMFNKLEQAQADLVFQDEPINQVLQLWLNDPSNHGREVLAGTLQREWTRVAASNGIWWPFQNPQSLAQELKRLHHALTQRFTVRVKDDLHKKQKSYWFWPKDRGRGGVEEHIPEWPLDGASPAAPHPPAGMAG
jgi:hypothetical protein